MNLMTIVHGGDLTSATNTFGIPKGQWIDLSTGISPWSWPVPTVPEIIWQSLPDAGDGLEQAAAEFYGCDADAVLPVAGSQAGLQKIPAILDRGPVAIPFRGYEEHRLAWFKAGHDIVSYRDAGQLEQLITSGQVRHAVVINPNNPTGEIIERETLLVLKQQLQKRQGWLLVDEAFMDAVSGKSLVSESPEQGLIVLRSLGKFFGLAGLRLGFVIAPPDLWRRLTELLAPWGVSHPARWVGKQALTDIHWHRMQRQRLISQSAQWNEQLTKNFPGLRMARSPLFVSGSGDAGLCECLYRELGQLGVLVRLFEEKDRQRMIRFGLPDEKYGSKLATILHQASVRMLCTIS
jgi:cobalamin biosynthetic protein CobC